jgi:acetolactate synthase-1/2/3 large subunit
MNHNLNHIAGESMSGADIILRVLAEQGVDTLFGYSGGAILPTYDAVFRFNETHADRPERQIRLVVPANEQAAGFMAAGYARASGKVGVFMVTSGPGATNAVTPIADCNGDSVPVVLICGQVPRSAIGSDAFQEAPVFNIMCVPRSKSRARDGPGRSSSTCRRTSRTGGGRIADTARCSFAATPIVFARWRRARVSTNAAAPNSSIFLRTAGGRFCTRAAA